MKVVVTGASGFLGSHLLKYCENNGYEVIAVHHALLNDIDALGYKLRNGFDYVIHVAAYGNYYDHDDDFQMIESNVVYTHNLLQATKDFDYSGFIYVSSSSVYGRKTKPMDELDHIDPETLYAATKAASEHIVSAHAKKYHKPAFSVRPFTLYGPGDNFRHFIPTVIDSIKADQKIYLDPLPVHDYIYITDAVNAIFTVKDQGKDYPGSVVNIGTGTQYTNEEVVQQIATILQKKASIVVQENQRSYDSRYWCADTALLNFLGFTPEYDLVKGLMELIYGKQA